MSMCLVFPLIRSIVAMEIAAYESAHMVMGCATSNFRLTRTFRMWMISFAVSEIAIYSASEVDVATHGVTLEVQDITLLFNSTRNPNDERLEGMLSPWLASENAEIRREELLGDFAKVSGTLSCF